MRRVIMLERIHYPTSRRLAILAIVLYTGSAERRYMREAHT